MKCVLCGKEVENEEDLTKGVCEDCITEKFDYFYGVVENAIKVGEKKTDYYSVNDFFLKTWDSETINETLEQMTLKKCDCEKAEKYLLENKELFAELLKEGS